MDIEIRKKMLVELRVAMEGGDNFSAILIRLALKADSKNLDKLALGFPDEVAIVRSWRLGEIDQEEVYPNG